MTENKKIRLKEWAVRINDIDQSKMTVQKWCDVNGFSKDTYYYWKKEVEKHQVWLKSSMDPEVLSEVIDDRTISDDEPVFVEVSNHVAAKKQPHHSDHRYIDQCFSESRVIIQHNRFQIYIGEGFNASILKQVLEVIEHA